MISNQLGRQHSRDDAAGPLFETWATFVEDLVGRLLADLTKERLDEVRAAQRAVTTAIAVTRNRIDPMRIAQPTCSGSATMR